MIQAFLRKQSRPAPVLEGRLVDCYKVAPSPGAEDWASPNNQEMQLTVARALIPFGGFLFSPVRAARWLKLQDSSKAPVVRPSYFCGRQLGKAVARS